MLKSSISTFWWFYFLLLRKGTHRHQGLYAISITQDENEIDSRKNWTRVNKSDPGNDRSWANHYSPIFISVFGHRISAGNKNKSLFSLSVVKQYKRGSFYVEFPHWHFFLSLFIYISISDAFVKYFNKQQNWLSIRTCSTPRLS